MCCGGEAKVPRQLRQKRVRVLRILPRLMILLRLRATLAGQRQYFTCKRSPSTFAFTMISHTGATSLCSAVDGKRQALRDQSSAMCTPGWCIKRSCAVPASSERSWRTAGKLRSAPLRHVANALCHAAGSNSGHRLLSPIWGGPVVHFNNCCHVWPSAAGWSLRRRLLFAFSIAPSPRPTFGYSHGVLMLQW